MSAPADDLAGAQDTDWLSFSAMDRMTNHWDRPGWRPGRSAYYWYLSFRDEPAIHVLAQECRSAVAGPHFDPIEPSDLHMTVERVGLVDEVAAEQLDNLAHTAAQELTGFTPLDVSVGPLAGSAGALSFSASPRSQLSALRLRLLSATHAAGFAPDILASDPFRPHVGIGYCNQEIDAEPIIDRVRLLRALPTVTVRVREVVLVELTRRERAYDWTVKHRLPFAIAN